MKKLAFMHIAKTAGSSVNDYFASLYGSKNALSFAEHDVWQGESLESLFLKFKFVSGHLFFGHFASLPSDVARMTIIREPIAQLASHIRWLDHYNDQEFRSEYSELTREVRDLIDFVNDCSIATPEGLDELLTHLPPYGLYLLNNLQARYLVGDSALMDPLSLNDADFSIGHLETFDYVLTLKGAPKILPLIAQALGFDYLPFEMRSNEATGGRIIDVSNATIRGILQKHLLVDLEIYRRAQRLELALVKKIGSGGGTDQAH